MTPKEMITVEKEVYEAVLRNSLRVNDLEAENQQLRALLKKCLDELQDFNNPSYPAVENLLTRINAAIGESEE